VTVRLMDDVRSRLPRDVFTGLFRRTSLQLAALTAATATLYSAFALQQHANLRTATYDLVIFDQAMRAYAGFGAPVSLAKGVHNGFGADFSILGDHFSPLLAAWAPLYWVRPDPTTLLVAQAVCLALAVPIVWVAARRLLGGARAAWLVAAAFALSWPIQEALAADVHEVAFAVPLLALVLERLSAGHLGQAAAISLTLLLVKEDMGLVIAALGGLIALTWPGRRRLGLGLVGGGLAAVAVSIRVLIPAFGGRAGYYSAYYSSLSPGDPASAVRVLVSPGTKVELVAWLVLPLLLLCLASPLSVLAAPLLLERLLSANPNHWSTGHHYNAYLAPVLMLAAAAGAARLPAVWRRRWAAAACATAVALCAVFPFQRLLRPGEWQTTGQERAAAAAIAAVPDGATVEAANNLGPHLTARATVLLLDATPRGAPWVIADVERPSFPFASVAEQRDRVARLRGQGYAVVFDQAGYVVLRRESDESSGKSRGASSGEISEGRR
jgi:uncharacterized membrane protein